MRYIDQEKIYEQTDQGYKIFEHYFSSTEIGNSKDFLKVRDEKTGSARITWYQGFWRITDFGNQGELNGSKAIEFVMWKEHLTYYDALTFIEEVIIKHTVESGKFLTTKFQPEYSSREMTPQDKKGAYNFVFKEHPTIEDLSAFGRYVTEECLDHFYCKCVEQYEHCSVSKKLNRDIIHIFKATKDFPIFLFDYGEFKKLYKPHEESKKYRFLYIGTKPTNYIFGLKQLKKADNEFADSELEQITLPEDKPEARVRDVFRCSGESDAINLYSLGYHPYWLNSETKEYTWEMFKQVNELCENHYQIMDLDTTGNREALKNALNHISVFTLELPQWLKHKNDWRGNPCKDLKDFVNQSGKIIEDTRYEFLVLKRSALRVKFWNKIKEEKTKKVSYNLNMEDFFFFLKCNGFYQMDSVYHKKAGYCYVKLENKSATLIHPDDIKRLVKRFTKDWIRRKKLMDAKEILNKLNGSTQISEANIDGLAKIELNFKNHDKNTEYIHFKNCSVRIEKDKIETIKQEQIPNYILGALSVNNKPISQQIDRNFKMNDIPGIEINATPDYQILLDEIAACRDEDRRADLNVMESNFPDIDRYTVKINDNSFFVNFLHDLSRLHWRKEIEYKQELTDKEKKEESLLLANLCFILGYHSAQYKDPGKAWLTLIQDYVISEIGQASGGSGKSLLSKAITYVRSSFYKGGRTLNDKNVFQFFYDGYTEFHDFIEIDDMHEYTDFGFFYTQITGPREVNPKNYTPFVLDYKDSGKMLISTNYELTNVDSSTYRRLLNSTVSDYYHEKTKINDYKETRSPATKYGKRLYDDFSEEEWIKFFNLIAYCIQLQQRFFKIQPPTENLERRQLRRAMASGLGKDEEFFRWANDYFILSPNSAVEYSPPENGYFNTLFSRESAFTDFTGTLTTKQKNEYKSAKFKKHLEAWCKYHAYILNPDSVCTNPKESRITRSIDGKTKELFFISTKQEGSVFPDLTLSDNRPF